MILKVSFKLNNIRKNPIKSGYTPTWIFDIEVGHCSAMLSFDNKDCIKPDETYENCYLKPFAPELWTNIKHGDTIKCMEGFIEVGDATVTRIFSEAV